MSFFEKTKCYSKITLPDEKNQIGSGAYGKVLKYEKFAAKKMKKYKLNHYISEIAILIRCDHPNIIKLTGIYTTLKNIYLIMPLAIGDLSSIKITEKQKEVFSLQILKAIDYIHSRGICHNDIKPDNILIMDEHTVCLCDFGLSIDNSSQLNWAVQTLWYRSPEFLLEYETVGKDYYKKSDIWALGCTLYKIITEIQLFRGCSDTDQLFSIFRMFGTPREDKWKKCPNYKTSFPIWDKNDRWKDRLNIYPDTLKNFVFGCLTFDPDVRPDSSSLLNIFDQGINSNTAVGHRIFYPNTKNTKNRTIVGCWLFDVCLCFNLDLRCHALSCYIYDLYKPRKNLQRCALSCFYIAHSYIMGFNLDLEDLVFICDNSSTEAEIENEAYDICEKIGYDIQVTTTYDIMAKHRESTNMAQIILAWINSTNATPDPVYRVEEVISIVKNKNKDIINKYKTSLKVMLKISKSTICKINSYGYDIISFVEDLLSEISDLSDDQKL